MKKKIIAVLLTFLMLSLSGCGILEQFESTPEKTVYGFIDAMNHEDVNKALEYIAPSQAKGVKAMISLAGSFIGFDINDLIDMLPLFSSMSDEYDSTIDLDFEVTNVETSEEEAWVTGVEYNSGEEVTFYLVIEDGRWYIWLEDF